ncbi:DUF2381 family protein [Corallococcus interemptor]|uniref:DUF2381 family protein n=1 Tax=Corallococcus interemptor TaxID=2316720 RepID=A0A3A8R471_9BACT|nr:DUF2381 family protein [Corallococcus interemptor]
MLQPFRWVLALALVWGPAARSEPPPGVRGRRERSVAVASTSAEPLPIVRIAGKSSAAGVPTRNDVLAAIALHAGTSAAPGPT